MPETHTVAQGENLSTIAQKHGFQDWQTVYDAPENDAFRQKRPDPSLISPGDQIVIPDKKLQKVGVKLGAQQQFKVKAPKPLSPQIQFGFFSKDNPSVGLSNLQVQMQLPPDGTAFKAVTDSGGLIKLAAPQLAEGTVRITQIRDPGPTPELNFDKFGGDFLTGSTYSIELPADPIQAALPIALARSSRRPRVADDGSPARDILHGDYTKAQILDIRSMFAVDNFGRDLDTVTSAELFADFRRMATELFATGDLEANILRMIAQFEANTGADYSDPTLTTAVQTHQSTINFENNVRRELKRLIDEKKGDVSLISNNEMVLNGRPRYNTTADTVRGLTIAINDTHAFDVDLTQYKLQGSNYNGVFRITLYDHFGLDQPDVEKRFGLLVGFRSWFILQHLDRLNFKPFVTKIEMDHTFSGTVGA